MRSELIIIIIIIHLFYKAPFKALKVAVQHIKNSEDNRTDYFVAKKCPKITK